jgi:hypothetical protein
MINVSKLSRELKAASIPFLTVRAEGEIVEYAPEATSQQMINGNTIVAAHDPVDYDAQDANTARQELLTDLNTAITYFTNSYNNWASLTAVQKDTNQRNLNQAMFRLLRWLRLQIRG